MRQTSLSMESVGQSVNKFKSFSEFKKMALIATSANLEPDALKELKERFMEIDTSHTGAYSSPISICKQRLTLFHSDLSCSTRFPFVNYDWLCSTLTCRVLLAFLVVHVAPPPFVNSDVISTEVF
jgi:hypothetical protein